MSVYDKELIIDGEAVRSPEQQVFKNMKDIKKLKEIIKPEYTTSATLTSSSVSVAIADTNAPEGTTEGWLLTQDGLKFKITGGDETNLLLEFYADLKGPQGESGAELEIDDSGTSATKVWSSQKVASELAQAGKTYYQHNILVKGEKVLNGYTKYFRGFIVITNDSNLPFVKSNQYIEGTNINLYNWLYNKSLDGSTQAKSYPACIGCTSRDYFAIGIGSDGTDLNIWEVGDTSYSLGSVTITDIVLTI